MSSAPPLPPRRRRFARVRRISLVALLLLCGWIGFGLTGGDYVALRSFTGAVHRWQVNPEFRFIAMEYSLGGSDAMRTRPMLVPAARGIMAVRSVPLMPREFAVNPTSALHYENFGRGPLSAYLHLSSEQSVKDIVPMVESLGQKPVRSEADLRQFLDGFKMDYPVVKDAGALRSADSLVADVGGGKTFAVRTEVGPLLEPHIAALAAELGFPPDPREMTAAQQRAVLERLDSFVRRRDYELWRAKQVNDFCGGLWAQVFGQPYNYILEPYLWARVVCRAVVALLLVWLAARFLYERRRRRHATTDRSQSALLRAGPETPPAPG